MSNKLAVAIPTTASWAPGRAGSLARLLADLGLSPIGPGVTVPVVPAFGSIDCFIHDNRSPRETWSETIWTWGSKSGATHFLQIQDDVRAAPGGLFWRSMYAMIEARQNGIINLQSVHEASPGLAAERVTSYTCSEGMPGPCYEMDVPLLTEFLEWRRTKLRDGTLQRVTEDTLLALFCLDTQRRIWSPVPTVVDHPGEVGSTYGNDVGLRQDLYATRQRPRVRWDNWEQILGAATGQKTVEIPNKDAVLSDPRFWAGETRHLGRFYPMSIPALARIAVKGYSEEDEERDVADTGTWEKQRLVYAAIGRRKAPMARVFVCTPFRGGVSFEYIRSIFRLHSALHDIEVIDGMTAMEPEFLEGGNADLVRTRSHLLRRAKESGASHTLLVDGDVGYEPEAVVGMFRSGFDFVQTPYPRRDGRGYSLRLLDSTIEKGGLKFEPVVRDTLPIMGTGLGCTLLTRRCILKMWNHYKADADPEEEFEKLVRGGLSRREMVKAAYELGRSRPRLVYTDFPRWEPTPKGIETVALFQLMIEKDSQVGATLLYGEDISFCKRWIALGEEVRMYIGQGSPAEHAGEHLYKGDIFQLTGIERSAPPEGT